MKMIIGPSPDFDIVLDRTDIIQLSFNVIDMLVCRTRQLGRKPPISSNASASYCVI